ncbi:MAG TPA: glycoside hydrolase family 30 beta sandwich domain-containing protein [Dyella sp.]|uniref:glycoside hydrolase family 30 protein n=1 Tax=Dyella sp. TaxID=1869338 RepID=UPI002CC0C433|nr:glycoside hydrolase family 30 beta sandwich domain-containing protein [Dyella sp.]HTV83903.1 glycoside hydrolase family 30 beta sandwich domain-containing protein [Dyella sp.]
MDERKHQSNRVAAALTAVLALFTVLALTAPQALRLEQRVRADPGIVGSAYTDTTVVELWLSTADRRLKLARQPDIEMSARGPAATDIVIDTHKTYQTIVGFGAAMTDSSAWLLENKLGALQRFILLHELYGPPPGLNFNMMRVTIGASDFSLKPYTLDDVPSGQVDPQLTHFNIAPDLLDVIPAIHEVLAINPGLRIIASSWSAPGWMKTSGSVIGGTLLQQYESVFADYLVKYLDAYRDHGIPIFALTMQNEPAFIPATYPGMGMPAPTRARVIAQYLGPKLAKRKQKTSLLEWDHNWSHPEEPLSVLGDPKAAPYIDGVAWHCYEGVPTAQSRVHRAYPQKDTYISECSGGDWGSAMHGELLWFARDLLLAGLRHWARGVVYWNLALDENHGPHFGGCTLCKGIVLIDSRTGAISRNDEYYAFAHFSRFVLPGAVRIGSTDTDHGIYNVAFQNSADDSIVLVVVNGSAAARNIAVSQDHTRFEYIMPAQSVATFVWEPGQVGAWRQRLLWWLKKPR